jgi:hypothetical protein
MLKRRNLDSTLAIKQWLSGMNGKQFSKFPVQVLNRYSSSTCRGSLHQEENISATSTSIYTRTQGKRVLAGVFGTIEATLLLEEVLGLMEHALLMKESHLLYLKP